MRNYHEITIHELRSVINRLRERKVRIRVVTDGHHTKWIDDAGRAILREYVHKKSRQCLVINQYFVIVEQGRRKDNELTEAIQKLATEKKKSRQPAGELV